MNRISIMEDLFLKNTGLVVDGAAIWEEIERVASECSEDGPQWVTGQDDKSGKWEYYVDIKHGWYEESEQGYTDVELLEVCVTRPEHETAQFSVPRFL